MLKCEHCDWTENGAEEAVNACHRGMSIRRAAELYGIPKSTICDKLNGKMPIGQKKGPPMKLSPELEDRIEKWIIHMARIGYGQMMSDILDKVEELLNKLNIQKKFGDSNRPSIKRYTLFMERHPDLQMRMTSALSHARCDVSYDNLTYWFQELKDYMREVKQADILQDLSRICNCDETGFPLALKTKKVIVLKHDKHVYQDGMTSNKTQITILLAASAHYVKLLVMYPGVQPRRELCDDYHCRFPEGLFGNSPSGWMDTELFHMWLENGFIESLIE